MGYKKKYRFNYFLTVGSKKYFLLYLYDVSIIVQQ